jgi:hypothetical protein
MLCLIPLVLAFCLACDDRDIDEEHSMGDRESALEAGGGGLPSLESVPKAAWGKLANKTIFFGHHSVGYNILDGVRDVATEKRDIQLEIVETSDPAQLEGSVFAHARVGKNQDPLGKVREFERVMDSGLAEKTDIAFFKFCYVDFYDHTEIDPIFDAYRQTMQSLVAKYPGTDFVHVTVPLKAKPTGLVPRLKEIAKMLLGRPASWEHNRRRNQFNERIRSTFGDSSHVYDLARVESARPDGSTQFRQRGDDRVSEMVPTYTTDGGHLNQEGRRRAAEQLLILLASIAGEPASDQGSEASGR